MDIFDAFRFFGMAAAVDHQHRIAAEARDRARPVLIMMAAEFGVPDLPEETMPMMLIRAINSMLEISRRPEDVTSALLSASAVMAARQFMWTPGEFAAACEKVMRTHLGETASSQRPS